MITFKQAGGLIQRQARGGVDPAGPNDSNYQSLHQKGGANHEKIYSQN